MLRNYVPLGEDREIALVNSTLFVRVTDHSLTNASLGLAELYLALAMLFRPNGPALEPFETDESDVVRVHDFIIALPKLDTEGVRVTVG